MARWPAGTLMSALALLVALVALACNPTESTTPTVTVATAIVVTDAPVVRDTPVVSDRQVETPITIVPGEVGPSQGNWVLSVDPATGFTTLNANEAPLVEILKELREKHQVNVTVPELTDRVVTVDIENVPLPDALAAFLPRESRYRFSVAEIEIAIDSISGEKVPRRDLEPKRPDLPVKDKAKPLPDELRTAIKIPPDLVKRIETNGERGTKFAPEDVLEVPLSKGPKRAINLPPEQGRYARINLHIDSDGVRVVGFLEIEGTLLEPTTVDGELIHVAMVNGTPVAVGSLQDPLGVRSYLEDNTGHSLGRDKEAFFLISLPDKFLSQSSLERTEILFFYLEPVGPIPSRLTPDTFREFDQHLRPIGSINADEILKFFADRARPEGDRG